VVLGQTGGSAKFLPISCHNAVHCWVERVAVPARFFLSCNGRQGVCDFLPTRALVAWRLALELGQGLLEGGLACFCLVGPGNIRRAWLTTGSLPSLDRV
jgi:hypothetical protein